MNIEAAIAAEPILRMHIQNYHYEERVTKDKDGNERRRKVRVNTHRADEPFRFTDWIDRSPPASSLHYIDLFLLTRIHTEKDINLSPQASRSYASQKSSFIRRHHTDVHYDYSFQKKIPHH